MADDFEKKNVSNDVHDDDWSRNNQQNNNSNQLDTEKKKKQLRNVLEKKKYKFIGGGISLAIIILFIIINPFNFCLHRWENATCTKSEYCSKCFKERGEPLGHDYIEPTCEEDGYCIRCGEKGAQELGHNVPAGDMKVVKTATYEDSGLKQGTCKRCHKTISESIPMKASLTKKYFDIASNLNVSDLTRSTSGGGAWYYKGFALWDEDDIEWINSKLNTTGQLNQGTAYRVMAWQRKIHNLSKTWKEFCEVAYGFMPVSNDEVSMRAEKTCQFISTDDYEFKPIMQAIKASGCASGDFDFDDGLHGVYDVTITNLESCAKKMLISEEMLGYILSDLLEYGADITFDGNTCHIYYEGYYR